MPADLVHELIALWEASDVLAFLQCHPGGAALHNARQKHLIHRDFKPANILIEDRTDAPFVADFGMAITEENSLSIAKGLSRLDTYLFIFRRAMSDSEISLIQRYAEQFR